MIKTKLLVNLVIVGILIFSSNSVFAAVSLPDEVPGIATQTAQKDKAAVVLLSSVVTGIVSWPSFTMELAVDESILGTWQHPNETVIFNADGRFSCITIDGIELSGTYATEGGVLTLYYTAPIITTAESTYTILGDTLTIGYSYTKISEETTDDDIVAIAENFMFVMETGIDATLETDVISAGVSGTGFIVSPDGYIITNAHVVLAGEDLTGMIATEFIYSLADAFSEEFSQYYDILQEDQEAIVEILVNKFLDYFVENNGDITDITTDYYVVNGVPSPGEDIEAKSWPAVVKKQGTAYTEVGGVSSWGEDIAIIKVDETGLPTVTLGDSSKVEGGHTVFIIGYPTTGIDEFFQPESLLEPTVTQGVISSTEKILKTGIKTFQTDAAINHGNSGGPAYNDDGEVIGIATFGAGPETGIANIMFLMPINLAKEFMNDLNVENEHSIIDTKYAEALNAFWNRDCYTTIDKMNEVLALYPDHPYAQEYIDECNRAIAAGEVPEPGTPTPGFELIFTICAIALILFWKRKR